MIIHTGNRTDIPAFYSKWFVNRLKEEFVLVRNPYNPRAVTRFWLKPDVVDLIAFCKKSQSIVEMYGFAGAFWTILVCYDYSVR